MFFVWGTSDFTCIILRLISVFFPQHFICVLYSSSSLSATLYICHKNVSSSIENSGWMHPSLEDQWRQFLLPASVHGISARVELTKRKSQGGAGEHTQILVNIVFLDSHFHYLTSGYYHFIGTRSLECLLNRAANELKIIIIECPADWRRRSWFSTSCYHELYVTVLMLTPSHTTAKGCQESSPFVNLHFSLKVVKHVSFSPFFHDVAKTWCMSRLFLMFLVSYLCVIDNFN